MLLNAAAAAILTALLIFTLRSLQHYLDLTLRSLQHYLYLHYAAYSVTYT